MVMAYDQMTPQERAAVQQIQQMRQQLMMQGLTQEQADEAIFSGQALQLAGGYNLANQALDAAGIAAQYNLGRGNLALNAYEMGLNQVANPFNVVAANQFYADQQGSPQLTDPTLSNVPGAGVGSPYLSFVDSILYPKGTSTPSGAPAITLGQKSQVEAAYAADPVAAEQFFAAQSGTQPRPAAQVQQSRMAPSAAQSTAATQIAGRLPGMSNPQFRDTLASGQVPGMSSINARDFSLMDPDSRDQYLGLVQSTGRTSNAARAYQDMLRLYGTPGTGYAGVQR